MKKEFQIFLSGERSSDLWSKHNRLLEDVCHILNQFQDLCEFGVAASEQNSATVILSPCRLEEDFSALGDVRFTCKDATSPVNRTIFVSLWDADTLDVDPKYELVVIFLYSYILSLVQAADRIRRLSDDSGELNELIRNAFHRDQRLAQVNSLLSAIGDSLHRKDLSRFFRRTASRILYHIPLVDTPREEIDRYFDDIKSIDGFPDAKCVHYEGILRLKDPELMAGEVNNELRTLARGNPNALIFLSGEGVGALIAKRAYLNDQGFGLTKQQIPAWSANLQRMVLFSCCELGYERPRSSWSWKPGRQDRRRDHTLKSGALKDSLFISGLRIDCVRFANANPNAGAVIVYVNDNVDPALAEIEKNIRLFSRCTVIPVPRISRKDSLTMCTPVVKDAFAKNVYQRLPSTNNHSEKRVVYLLHGIRTSRECWKKLKNLLNQDPENLVTAPDYGEISIAEFVSKKARERALKLFASDYATRLNDYPNLEYAFAGHSNGTLIFVMAIRRFPGMIFTRAWLGASVLPRDFPTTIPENQVPRIRCENGTRDNVVGVGCRALMIVDHSIGVSGSDGCSIEVSQRLDHRYVEGGHSSMLNRVENLTTISQFITTGVEGPVAQAKPSRKGFQKCLAYGLFLFVVATFIALILGFGYGAFVYSQGNPNGLYICGGDLFISALIWGLIKTF